MKTLTQNSLKIGYLYRLVLFVLVFSMSTEFVVAQSNTGAISGVLIDNDTREPLIGATVVIAGTPKAAVTDLDGKYLLPGLAAGTYSVEVAYVGYKKQTHKVVLAAKESKSQDFILLSNTQLSEVVVTALGIKREEKSLGYAVSQVSSEELNKTVSNNWLNGMAGKVAGLNFDQASAGPGGSIRVTLRGEGSLSHGKNTALFVIDGVPIGSDMASNTSGGNYSSNDAPIDYGNGASDLNPDDIESVSVLKGPAATALYGSRAANGAIIITTKSGTKGKGIGVTINSSVTFEKAGFWPDFQNEYGAGDFRKQTVGGTVVPPDFSYWTVKDQYDNTIASRKWSRYAFGAKLDGRPSYLYASRNWETGEYTPLPFVAQDFYKGFFDTGVTYNNSVSISNSTKSGSVRLSIRDTHNTWIVPNTGYNSQNISLAVTQEIHKRVKLDARVTYYRKNSDNLPMSGYNTSSPLYSLIWSPTVASVNDYKNEYNSGRIDKIYESGESKTSLVNQYNDNPYFIVNEHLNTMVRDRVYGNASLSVNLIPKKLDITMRTGMDLSSDFRTQRKPFYSVSAVRGMYREQNTSSFEMNNDFLLSYKDKFGDFDLTTSVGGNNMYYRYSNTAQKASNLLEKNIYMLNNTDGRIVPTNIRDEKAINSFYGFGSIGWKSMLYLELTARNDWSSTLARGNNSYFYPSVNTSILFNEVFNLREKAPFVDLLKARASWANVGNDTDPYQLIDTYGNSSFDAGYRLPNVVKNYELKPENVESWEFGLETRMFRNRLGLDLTWYHSSTTDQIIDIPADWSTGTLSRMINAGEVVNKGIEISLNAQPIDTKDWTWDVSFNWSKNWNKLVSLAPGVDLWQLNKSNTVGGRVFVYAMPGTELGRIHGAGYERAPKGSFYTDANGQKVDVSGQVVVEENTGLPMLSSEPKDLGSIFPDWKGGFNQTIRYKDFSLGMSFAFQHGGKAYSVTNFALSYMGKLKNSLPGRYDGLVHEGVNRLADGSFIPNSTITTDIVEYYNMRVWNRDNVEQNVFSTSYLKMKELRLDYKIPRKFLKQTGLGFIQGVQLGSYATNLFCITNWPQYDPDVASLSGSSLNRGVETGGYPMTRTYGFNLKLNF